MLFDDEGQYPHARPYSDERRAKARHLFVARQASCKVPKHPIQWQLLQVPPLQALASASSELCARCQSDKTQAHDQQDGGDESLLHRVTKGTNRQHMRDRHGQDHDRVKQFTEQRGER